MVGERGWLGLCWGEGRGGWKWWMGEGDGGWVVGVGFLGVGSSDGWAEKAVPLSLLVGGDGGFLAPFFISFPGLLGGLMGLTMRQDL